MRQELRTQQQHHATQDLNLQQHACEDLAARFVKKSPPASDGTRKFITARVTDCHLSLSSDR